MRLEQQGLAGVGYGTVYSLMGRLRCDGLVTRRVESSPTGPPRKVFEVSPAERQALTDWTEQWVATTTVINGLLASAGALTTSEVRTDV